MQAVFLMAVAGLLAFVPAQSRSTMGVQSMDVCAGLSEAECCAQTLRLQGFKALGERLPRKAATLVDLSCKAPSKQLPPTACRAISIARGFKHAQADALCEPAKLQSRCSKDKACKACTRAVGKLSYAGSSPACLAVTHVPGAPQSSVVVISDPDTPEGNAVVVKKRTVIKPK